MQRMKSERAANSAKRTCRRCYPCLLPGGKPGSGYITEGVGMRREDLSALEEAAVVGRALLASPGREQEGVKKWILETEQLLQDVFGKTQLWANFLHASAGTVVMQAPPDVIYAEAQRRTLRAKVGAVEAALATTRRRFETTPLEGVHRSCPPGGEEPDAQPSIQSPTPRGRHGSRSLGVWARTIGARLARLSSFYRFLIRMRLVPANPCDALERPRVVVDVPRGLSADGSPLRRLRSSRSKRIRNPPARGRFWVLDSRPYDATPTP